MLTFAGVFSEATAQTNFRKGLVKYSEIFNFKEIFGSVTS